MERKTAAAYQSVFEVISNLGYNIIELMADFEIAIKQAFLAIYPAGTVFGCHFHLAQVNQCPQIYEFIEIGIPKTRHSKKYNDKASYCSPLLTDS